MNLKRLVFGFLFLCITSASFSQTKQYLYYFDKDLNTVESSKAVFYGTGAYEGDLLKLMLYNNLDKHLVMIEHFKDSSLQVSDGLFDSYYKNTAKELEGNYANGKEDGLWEHWDSAGHLIDSSIYENGEKINSTQIGYYKNGALDSFVTNDFKSNLLQKKFYDDSSRIISEVNFIGQKGFEKVYSNGIITREDSVFTREEIEASFPGGPNAWQRYIVSSMINKFNGLRDERYGTCIVKFIISTDGKIKNVEATTMQGTMLAKIAIDIIKDSPRWKPASQYGRLVNAYRLQPVTMTAPN